MGTIFNNADGLRMQFGTRKAGDEANFGTNGDVGPDKQIVVEIKGSDFTSNVYTGPTMILPAGATVRESLAEVTEVFVLGGTTPTINVGVSTTEATNRLAQLSQAQAQALGVVNTSATAAGTLAVGTPLAAQSTISIALGGTTPTVTAVGKLKITIKYADLTPTS